jgi:hypothetical protein
VGQNLMHHPHVHCVVPAGGPVSSSSHCLRLATIRYPTGRSASRMHGVTHTGVGMIRWAKPEFHSRTTARPRTARPSRVPA